MDKTSLHQARALCCLLDSVLVQIRADDQADEDVKLVPLTFRKPFASSRRRCSGRSFADKRKTTESLVLSPDCDFEDIYRAAQFRIKGCMERDLKCSGSLRAGLWNGPAPIQ
jgi:hypothetical protein